MEIPRPVVESELQLQAYTTATATWEPTSQQCQIWAASVTFAAAWVLNPLSKARDGTHILMDISLVHNKLNRNGNSREKFLKTKWGRGLRGDQLMDILLIR